jgi:glutathione S-transferase
VIAYLMDWANEQGLLDECEHLRTYLQQMYARPAAPPRIADERARIRTAN